MSDCRAVCQRQETLLAAVGFHNRWVGNPHSEPVTCFDGSEIRLPLGYTEGRRREALAFSRSIAISGKDFEGRTWSRFDELGQTRATHSPRRRCVIKPISAQSLGCLSVSPRLG